MISRELFKGTLKPIVLKLLTENKRMYGYEITQKVAEITGDKIKLTYGALYPVLHKLEKDGALRTETETINNRNRVYYMLTKKGTNTASEKIKELEDFADTLRIILKPNIGLAPCIS